MRTCHVRPKHPTGGVRLRSYCSFCGGPLSSLHRSRQDCVAGGVPTFHDDKPCTAVLVLDSVGNVQLGNQARETMLGRWDLPDGFCNPDETPEAGAVCELAEETGCAMHVERCLGHLIDTHGDDGDFTLNAVFLVHLTAGKPVPSDDVAELCWFPLNGLPAREQLVF